MLGKSKLVVSVAEKGQLQTVGYLTLISKEVANRSQTAGVDCDRPECDKT